MSEKSRYVRGDTPLNLANSLLVAYGSKEGTSKQTVG